jgi:cytochrome c biogenesis protein CcdA
MSGIDIAFGFLAGIVSCLTPEALLLFPLALGAAGADGRASVIAPAVGLGLSLVLTGLLAGSLGLVFGFEAIWFRRVVCVLLVLQGIMLMSASMVERHPLLTGGLGGVFEAPGATSAGGAFRQFLLALFVGANWWRPAVGPILGKASLMAADTWNSGLALEVLFAFGLGAAVPWIVLGRIVRFVSRPFAGGVIHGMAGKRLLGLALLVVALLGISGQDMTVAHWLGALLPDWTRKLAITF